MASDREENYFDTQPYGVVWALVPMRAASSWDMLPHEVRDVLRLCDGTRRLWAICAESPLPVKVTSRIVERLADLGLIEPHEPASERRRLSRQTRRWAGTRTPRSLVAVVATAAYPTDAVGSMTAPRRRTTAPLPGLQPGDPADDDLATVASLVG